MKLSAMTITDLSEFICGASGGGSFSWEHFPYRTSNQLTRFFRACDLPYIHEGGTRQSWVESVLTELNTMPSSHNMLPSDALVRLIQRLMDPVEFTRLNLDRDAALQTLNTALTRDGLEAYFDGAGRCHLRNTDTTATTAMMTVQPRPLSAEELRRRKEFDEFFQKASEDEFTEQVLVPLFRQLGFVRVTPSGHRDKALEYGKDVWMKYRLPTGHWIYFGVQVKKDRIDAAGSDLNRNIASILAQLEMLLQYPIFDPETNKRHLLDHVYIISSGGITKQAINLMAQRLDQQSRRHIIFMDREELLDLVILTNLPLPGEGVAEDPPF